MSKLYSYIFGSSSASDNASNGVKDETRRSNGMATPGVASISGSSAADSHETKNDEEDPLRPPHETTGLLQSMRNLQSEKEKISVHDYFFPKNNPSIQRYYRFTISPHAPFGALHKRPGSSDALSVTGLLHRSAVLASHGTDPTGDWVLLSVGGRSGWARKRRSTTAGGFVVARQFQVSEGWTGNHVFLCGGRIMLGSDAPLFFLANAMQIVGVGFYLVAVLPKLEDPSWLLTVRQNFILTCALLVISITSFWACAVTDPGILPPLSSPMKPPVPTDVHVGGPLGHRYCSTCNIFRPPRSKHCNSCNVCVSKFDQ